MKQSTSSWLMLVGLLLLMCISAFLTFQVMTIAEGIRNPTRQSVSSPILMTASSEVTSEVTELTTTIVTTREEGETIDDFHARHAEACEYFRTH